MLDQASDLQELRKAFEHLLDLPDIHVERVEQDRDGHYRVTVRSTQEGTQCHRCGQQITQRYGQAPAIELRHLPLFGKQVYFRIRPVRYQCPYCDQQPTTTQRLSWYSPKSPHTKAFEQAILFACINSTVEEVSRKEAIGYEAVMGILERHLRKEVDWEAMGGGGSNRYRRNCLEKRASKFCRNCHGSARRAERAAGGVEGSEEGDGEGLFFEHTQEDTQAHTGRVYGHVCGLSECGERGIRQARAGSH